MAEQYIKSNYVVKVGAFDAAAEYMEVKRVVGDWNLVISGTWSGTIKVLRLFKDNINLGFHSGADNASTLTHTLNSATSQMGVAIATTNALIGMWIRNDIDGSYGPITANNATTITATLVGGTGNDWDKRDTFSLFYEAASYTANTDPQAQEPENDTGLTVIASAMASGCALIRISQ